MNASVETRNQNPETKKLVIRNNPNRLEEKENDREGRVEEVGAKSRLIKAEEVRGRKHRRTRFNSSVLGFVIAACHPRERRQMVT